MNPGKWNLKGYEKDWKDYPKHMDFLRRDSPNFASMSIKREIYMDIFAEYLRSIKGGSTILDAGGGIGRFAIPLGRMGYMVKLVDSCEKNVAAASRHVSEEKLGERIDATLGDAENLTFSDNVFDAAFAIELLCYCGNPSKALSELSRVTKNGGLVFVSVEGMYGSLVSDERIAQNEFYHAMKNSEFRVKDYVYTKYYTRKEFETFLTESGLRVLKLVGSHYTLDGIFNRFAAGMSREKILEIEKMCRESPHLSELARAWVAVCVVEK